MVGDDAMTDRMRPVGIAFRCVGRSDNQRAHQVGRIIVMCALQHGGDALEPHTRVDRGSGQVETPAIGLLIILHEDEIPDLDETVAVLIGTAGRTARNPVAMIEKYLGTGAAGARVTHRPEIVRSADPDDAALGQTGNLAPETEGLVIVGIDGRHQPLFRQA